MKRFGMIAGMVMLGVAMALGSAPGILAADLAPATFKQSLCVQVPGSGRYLLISSPTVKAINKRSGLGNDPQQVIVYYHLVDYGYYHLSPTTWVELGRGTANDNSAAVFPQPYSQNGIGFAASSPWLATAGEFKVEFLVGWYQPIKPMSQTTLIDAMPAVVHEKGVVNRTYNYGIEWSDPGGC